MLCSAAGAALYVGPLAPTPAQAQALQPVVDVCTGITLPRSAVTEIIGAVNQPIVEQIETTVNGLTTVTLVLAPLATITDLNIDLSTILADAAAGDPISLQILDTDGNVITASDDCHLTADGITLNTEGGISIGGNAITGLGANGQTATAGELDAIAFGNNASTAVGATGAIAIGTDATATAANSVALGASSVADRGPVAGYTAPGITGTVDSAASSVADRGPVAGYTAPGITGTVDSAGSVSVGAAGAERQITNVAAGTAPTDAANVGQVTGLVAAATADSVQYDDATHEVVTLDGAGGTLVTNVADGTLAADSTDAVNGSQLFATNQNVAALDGRVTQNETDIANLQTTVGSQQTTITNFDNRITQNEGDIASLDARTTVNEGDIVGLQAQIDNVPVGYVSDADGTTPSTVRTDTAAFVGASGGAVRVTNVDDGNLAATSTDAVNGSQLYATNQQVATNTADIQTINNNLAGSTVVAVQYSDPANPTVSNGGTITNDVTLIGATATPVRLHNVANGTLANDAVNLGQLQAGMASTLAGANTYTDNRFAEAMAFAETRFEEMSFDLRRVRRDALAGTAAAMTMAGLPQPIDGGTSMVGGAIAHYRGETAFGLGVSHAADDGRSVYKASATIDTHGRAGVVAGAGFAF